MHLEPEHEDLLALLVEATRSVPRHERSPFFLANTAGGQFLMHETLPGRPEVSDSDLKDLTDAGLLRRGLGSQGMSHYEVRPQGFAHYDQLKRRHAGQVERLQTEVQRYLDTRLIPSAYQAAMAKWRRADDLLWSADTNDQLTNIGHICREAMQEFAQAMVDRLKPPDAGSLPRDPQKTVDRIRTCIKHLGRRTGQAEAAWLQALMAYWGTVSDLSQRQEHGASKEAMIWSGKTPGDWSFIPRW